MKTIIKLAVLFATLLLVTGVSFAINGDCYMGDLRCYEISWTKLGTGETYTGETQICFDYGSQTGNLSYICDGLQLSLFFDMPSLTDKALAYSYQGIGYLTFHGHLQDFAGIFYCFGDRYKVKGTEVDCPY